ncbi:transposon Tf2-11 polyprotein [Trichonephila clavipes]|nr:transposon Tf2-11 polyprotein [Trichonephila clavipes]
MIPAERYYSTTERKALAVVWALEKFRGYVENQQIFLASDHQALKWLLSIKSPSGRLARGALKIQSFNLKIDYTPGKANVVADMLSRPSYTEGAASDVCAITVDVPSRKYSPESEEEAQLVVPAQERERILQEYHDAPTAGHYGVENTYKTISSRYFFQGMKKFISEYIKTFPECNRYKPTNQKPAGHLRTPAYVQRFETLAIDLFGPLPETPTGKKWTFIVEDTRTKWVELFALAEATAENCAKTLIEEVLLRYGLPRRLIIWKRQLRTSDDIRHDIRQVIDNDNFVPEITPYLKRFANSILDVKDRVEQKQDCQKENFDRRRRRKYYKPGDNVWVTIHPISRNNRSRKFMPKRECLYLILTLRLPVTYEIADPANPDQTLGTYVSAIKDYEEPETERNTGCVAPLKQRGRSKKKLSPGSKPRRQRNQRGSL